MTTQTPNLEELEEGDRELPSLSTEPGSDDRASRLKDAVRAAGGNAAVAQRAGIPVGTLNSYLRGRDMRLGASIRLAEATGVRLEWLATGAGPMRVGEAPAAVVDSPTPAGRPQALFSMINADRLGAAYAAARQALAARGQQDADPKRVMQITALIYDTLTEAEE